MAAQLHVGKRRRKKWKAVTKIYSDVKRERPQLEENRWGTQRYRLPWRGPSVFTLPCNTEQKRAVVPRTKTVEHTAEASRKRSKEGRKKLSVRKNRTWERE